MIRQVHLNLHVALMQNNTEIDSYSGIARTLVKFSIKTHNNFYVKIESLNYRLIDPLKLDKSFFASGATNHRKSLNVSRSSFQCFSNPHS